MQPPTSRSAGWLPQVPGRLRAIVRATEFGLVLLAALAGCLGGLAVAAMSLSTQALRELIYRLPSGVRLSAAGDLPPLVLLAGPVIGGALLGLFIVALSRWRKHRARAVIDPIEANALHGGRMSLRDSAYVAAQNVISNGGGASVGLEAGYTQIAGGIASRLGIAFELRRSDLRTLVGCGSAAAIAAAFGSPLTGAFYAFELIIGTYTIATLAPVVVAAFCGNLVAQAFVKQAAFVDLRNIDHLAPGGLDSAATLPCVVLGLICAVLGIAIMRGVAVVERAFQTTRLPRPVRPLIGGFLIGGLAMLAGPQILSGGHGALHVQLSEQIFGIGALLGLLVAKSAASAISIGSGFRGGLFFASLFLGALAGKLFAALGPLAFAGFADLGLTHTAYAIVGMAALAVAVVGGPLTMTFLTLEMTGSFPLAGLVLVAVIASSITVRRIFGYSFATWRFHLRGESIRSAHDIGWIRSLTVGKLMRKDIRPVFLDTPLSVFLRQFPLGSITRVVVVDEKDRYAGIVLVPDAHALVARDAGFATLRTAVRYRDDFLLPDMNAKQAMAAFDRTESEALVVVDDDRNRNVIGLLTESHTLKRYSDELDRQRLAMVGGTT